MHAWKEKSLQLIKSKEKEKKSESPSCRNGGDKINKRKRRNQVYERIYMIPN